MVSAPNTDKRNIILIWIFYKYRNTKMKKKLHRFVSWMLTSQKSRRRRPRMKRNPVSMEKKVTRFSHNEPNPFFCIKTIYFNSVGYSFKSRIYNRRSWPKILFSFLNCRLKKLWISAKKMVLRKSVIVDFPEVLYTALYWRCAANDANPYTKQGWESWLFFALQTS